MARAYCLTCDHRWHCVGSGYYPNTTECGCGCFTCTCTGLPLKLEETNMIKKFITNARNKLIPSKTTPNKRQLPWVRKQIRAKIRRKDKFHKLAKQTGNPRLFEKWKAIRAEIKIDIKKAPDEYVNNLIGDIGQDSKPF